MKSPSASAPDRRPALDEPQGPGQERHIPELDGLRGLAVLAVVFYHIAQRLMAYEHGWMHLAMDACLFGFLGVDVFFALSGFLITRILLRKREQAGPYYRNFYARRVLRLAPPYLLTLAIVAVFAPGNGASLLLSLVYLANFTALFHMAPGYGILWSLSIEEQFYLVWPTLLRRLSSTAILVLAFSIGVLTPVARTIAALHGTFDPYATWYRLDGLAWGAVLACLAAHAPVSRILRLFPRCAGGLGVLLWVPGTWFWLTGRKELGAGLLFSAVSLGTVAIISSAIKGQARTWAPLRSGFLRFFGDISYWMYLIHIFFLYKWVGWLVEHEPSLMRQGGLLLWLSVCGIVFLLSTGSGIAVRRWIELPALRAKGRFG